MEDKTENKELAYICLTCLFRFPLLSLSFSSRFSLKAHSYFPLASLPSGTYSRMIILQGKQFYILNYGIRDIFQESSSCLKGEGEEGKLRLTESCYKWG